jgi:SAM-dependent methyltransferase
MATTRLQLLVETFPRLAFFAYVAELRRLLTDCTSVLDVGCGGDSPLRLIGVTHTVGLDGHAPTLELARARSTHSELVLGRVEDMPKLFTHHQFDAVVALDLIEHLTPDAGRRLVTEMTLLARRRIVLFTPNGFIQQASEGGDLQEHLSGWTPDDLRGLGLDVIGMLGHRSLRGERHAQRIRPAALGGVVSVLSHYLYTRSRPNQAAALLATAAV